MPKKIIKNPRGMFAKNFMSDPLGRNFVEITYAARNRLGKLLRIKRTRRIKLPRGVKIMRIENNAPKVGFVTITFVKRKS